ncbi:type III-B CRISPR module RAMP protein Cmr4 [Pyrobaculum ferrireducens]|uniref:CRISPR-associated RAMP protein, Cmr4 family n=1 Tax=Pyrobaculum ferrireducens TaxID=1104324 RepID=G7VB09_9CREN|nr:type III-B CRISPR module RAMP protein Cmr4 [Pyrobaculum ferrireducens]AET32319.1 CRISPR-associated RAMP protein, Cmr4 family [Pyrobaculum ferrireducens]
MQALALFVYALSPLHVGVGRAEGAHVDLPVQRDEFELPVIWASSLKGALKSHAYKRGAGNDVRLVFGREPGERPDSISGVTLLDARLLLMPARSLRGVWIYVTTPHLLRLFTTYAEVYKGGEREGFKDAVENAQKLINNSIKNKALVSSKDYVDNGKIFLNEVEVEASVDPVVEAFANALRNLGIQLPKFDIAVVGDDLSREVIDRSLLVQYRVRLNRETKTVAEGGLWSEEYVPQFTLFHSAVVCRDVGDRTADKVCALFNNLLGGNPAVLWVGGKETIGKGLVRIWIK